MLLIAALCSTLVPARAAETHLPNLEPVARPEVLYAEYSVDDAQWFLYFLSTVANRGPADLVFRVRPAGLGGDTEQCVEWSGALCNQWAPSGSWTNTVGNGELCWLLRDMARFELRLLDDAGQPRMDGAGLLRGRLVNRFFRDEAYDTDYPADPVLPNAPRNAVCEGFVTQGLTAGWRVNWYDDYPEQNLSLAGIADGTYALVQTVDPTNVVRESNEDDNVLVMRVAISQNGRKAVVVP